ncbi:MAG: hypothetical protein JRI25_03715, partial [Deltaproteobacteria bacterium]|nr:hypothetical protein [Deltaproteobacteria bacterium]
RIEKQIRREGFSCGVWLAETGGRLWTTLLGDCRSDSVTTETMLQSDASNSGPAVETDDRVAPSQETRAPDPTPEGDADLLPSVHPEPGDPLETLAADLRALCRAGFRPVVIAATGVAAQEAASTLQAENPDLDLRVKRTHLRQSTPTLIERQIHRENARCGVWLTSIGEGLETRFLGECRPDAELAAASGPKASVPSPQGGLPAAEQPDGSSSGRPIGDTSRDMYRWVVVASAAVRGADGPPLGGSHRAPGLFSALDVRWALNTHLAFGGGVGLQWPPEQRPLGTYSGGLLPEVRAAFEIGPGRCLHGPYAGLGAGLRRSTHVQLEGPPTHYDEHGNRVEGSYTWETRLMAEAGPVVGFRAIWHPGFVADASIGALFLDNDNLARIPIVVRLGLGWAPVPPGTAPIPGYRDEPGGGSPEERFLVVAGTTVGILGILGLVAGLIIADCARNDCMDIID